MNQHTAPVIGQHATFYEGSGLERAHFQAIVKHVWSDTCVNLQLSDGRERTSVLVWQEDKLDVAPGGGYFCLLLPAVACQAPITGYRQLSQDEVALINEGKALAEKCGAYIEKLRAIQPSVSHNGLDQRWVSLGATDLQRGFMAVIRGIAQPTTF